MRRRYIFLGIAAVTLIGGWAACPTLAVWSMALATSKGEASSRAACDRIVFFGERAIPSTIASIERNSPWVPRYCYLPIALKEIGGSAQSDLRAAISKQETGAIAVYAAGCSWERKQGFARSMCGSVHRHLRLKSDAVVFDCVEPCHSDNDILEHDKQFYEHPQKTW